MKVCVQDSGRHSHKQNVQINTGHKAAASGMSWPYLMQTLAGVAL